MRLAIILLSLVFITSCKKQVEESEIPKSVMMVNDYENLFSAQQEIELWDLLEDHSKLHIMHFVVITTSDLGGFEDAQDYAELIGNEWEVGLKSRKNGIVVVISAAQRKTGIALTDKVSATISDEFCKMLIDSLMIPGFKEGDYYTGTKAAIQKLIEEWDSRFGNNEPSFGFDSTYVAKSFDFPVGKPNANGYYNAQKFQENMHLGDDWNAVTGGNSDLGDPIYSIANGYVTFAEDYGGGWGNVIRILHKLPDGEMVESLYAHCDTILVKESQWIKRGDQIGTIGNADGQYLAHLHLEIRDDIDLPVGAGYSEDTTGYLDPTAFIKAHREE